MRHVWNRERRRRPMRIGVHRYAVSIIARPDDDPAEIDTIRNTVEVIEVAVPSVRAVLLIHEALHGLLDDSGLDVSETMEERIVRALAPRIAAFLKDNPAAVRELLRMLR